MINRIAVCLDGSELAEQVLPIAAEMAQRFCAQLVLLRVIGMERVPPVAGLPEATTAGYTAEMAMEYQEAERRSAAAYCEVLINTLPDTDVACATPESTSAAQGIIDYTHQNQIDLIAIATHGRTGLGRTVLGSVADQVVRESHLPVLIIRPKEINA